VKRQEQHTSSGLVGPSPLLSFESQRVWWWSFGLLTLYGIIKGGIRPGPLDPRAWYDRALRAVGGLLILLVLGTGLVLLVRGWFVGSR
jgi:hypothetical protein